jgi:hypothetical protein
MKTLQEHYNAIKTGQGNKAQFVKQAKNLFPEYFNQYTNYDNAVSVLKSKQIISETAGGVVAKGFDIYDWKKILAEETKSVEKETSKQVLDAQAHSFDNKDMKNADNINFNEIMKGFYTEMKDPANAKKTGDELKAMVVKNLAKDCLYYTKNGEFGTKGIGYTTEAPGLGTPKEPKGKHKASGYGDLNTKTEKVKSNVQDSLGNSEAKTSNPKKVKEMPDKGVTGTEKKMKLQEAYNSKAGLTKKEQDKISDLSKEEKKALYDDLTDTTTDINDKDFKDKASYAKAMKDAKTKVYKKHGILENKETSDEKIARYKKYTYTLDGKEVKPDDIDFYDHLLGAKMGDRFYRIGIPSEDGKVKLKLRENTDEALYQGPSVKIGAGGGLGGKRFIPNVTALSRDAVDAINTKGARRLNWEKPHIKIVKSGDGVKLLISKLLVDTIVGSERGRSKLSLAVSKMGTGITPEEMSELSGEFKKLVKVLNTGGKLSQNGDYFLLDIPTKYNEKRNQFEMPLPAAVAEAMDPNNFELGQENPEDAPMGVNDKSSSRPMRAKVDIKSTLEKIATAVFTEKDLNKAKEIFRSHIEASGINERDKKIILRNIDLVKNKYKLDSYLVNSLLHYEGHGTSQLKENTAEQKLRSLIRNIINEELNK